MTGAGTVELRRTGSTAVLTLRREAKLNALSTHLERELLRALDDETVTTARAVVLTGGATVFSAGADTGELDEMTPDAIAAYYRDSGAVYEKVAALAQPTVAAIAGHCLGGGLELALAADFRVADPTAAFGLPEVGIGILPSSGGTYRTTRAVGPARARELILRGRRLTAEEALGWGLLTEVTGEGGHLEAALRLAGELAALPPLAVAVTKRVIDTAADSPREASLLLEQLAYASLNRAAHP
ncbi:MULTISPECIES: enoyl-CoA hydratase/isomerase family protein [unclassified Streptomyces]|uniref:enoyl-CoA hydratase/isomerase family protein n=1 Tax=unclassified Streptomyces TaxID=2593676 RepID=UPI000AF45E72|nr:MULTISPECIES: enoyl-CoA hydratase/isomerase family protein [unclassified Streptomyces]AZM58460.1 enoyl-CoA hydratase/isomerase family protein [Streptomyces sp. WAC 01438]RSM88970.1 enoyl-CoA hydratase/isomerase family protein [Streptomyces sp. WAC 01420]